MGRKLKIYLDTSVISALLDYKNPQKQQLTGEFFKIAGNFDREEVDTLDRTRRIMGKSET